MKCLAKNLSVDQCYLSPRMDNMEPKDNLWTKSIFLNLCTNYALTMINCNIGLYFTIFTILDLRLSNFKLNAQTVIILIQGKSTN